MFFANLVLLLFKDEGQLVACVSNSVGVETPELL